jgi:hypothetical protein
MKFLLLLWITIRGTFEAAVWATAVWCILYSFTNVLWLQCFWVFIPIHFIWNMSCVEYVRTHTKRDCFCYMLIESISVGLSIIHALIISILPTIAAIVLLSLLEVWTNLETHWLHTWLFVACVVYSLSRRESVRTCVSGRSKREAIDLQPYGNDRRSCFRRGHCHGDRICQHAARGGARNCHYWRSCQGTFQEQPIRRTEH